MSVGDPKETKHVIAGPAGQLELLQLSPVDPLRSPGVAIICHPHPLFEGTMHNKVVYTLSRAFHQLGLGAVRFNYRGVGQSEGEYGHSIGEVADLMAVLEWVDKGFDHPKIWLAGFSFGAYIAAKGAENHPCEQLFSIAPAVTNQDFASLEVRCPWTVIQGELDEVIAPEAVYQWAKNQGDKVDLLRMGQASHFFHGQLIALRSLVEKAVIFSPI